MMNHCKVKRKRKSDSTKSRPSLCCDVKDI